MKENRELSMAQLMAAVWAWTMGSLGRFFTLPGGAAGGAWLLPLLVLPLLLAAGWLLGRVSGGAGLAWGLYRGLGPVPGRCALVLYMVWAVLLAGAAMSRCALRLSGGEGGSPWLFLGALLGTAFWMARGETGTFGRMAQGVLAALLVTAGAVLLLALSQGEWALLRPERGEGREWLRGIAAAADVLSPGMYGAFLLGRTAGRRRERRFLGWTAVGCAGLSAALGVIQSCFGPVLSARLEEPLFTLAQGVGIEGAFQRGESLVSALWSGTELMGVLLLFRAAEEMGNVLLPGRGKIVRGVIEALSALAAAGRLRGIELKLPPGVSLLIVLLPVGAAAILDAGHRRGTGSGISCGEEGK